MDTSMNNNVTGEVSRRGLSVANHVHVNTLAGPLPFSKLHFAIFVMTRINCLFLGATSKGLFVTTLHMIGLLLWCAYLYDIMILCYIFNIKGLSMVKLHTIELFRSVHCLAHSLQLFTKQLEVCVVFFFIKLQIIWYPNVMYAYIILVSVECCVLLYGVPNSISECVYLWTGCLESIVGDCWCWAISYLMLLFNLTDLSPGSLGSMTNSIQRKQVFQPGPPK